LKDDGFKDTGFVSLAVLYLMFALSSLVSTPIVNKINNVKISMSCAALCYSTWIASFILPSLLNEGTNINSYFWGFYKSSNVFGNVIAAIVLELGAKKSTLFVLFTIVAMFGSFLFCFLKKPEKEDEDRDFKIPINNSEISKSSSINRI
jgi:hypothetical protein